MKNEEIQDHVSKLSPSHAANKCQNLDLNPHMSFHHIILPPKKSWMMNKEGKGMGSGDDAPNSSTVSWRKVLSQSVLIL